jgi:hypothetical protein
VQANVDNLLVTIRLFDVGSVNTFLARPTRSVIFGKFLSLRKNLTISKSEMATNFICHLVYVFPKENGRAHIAGLLYYGF